jgi:inhibitor of KinA
MYPLGERAVTVRWSAEMNREANQRALALLKHLENEPFTGYVEAVPAYTSLTVYYDPILVYRKTKQSPYTAVCQWLKSRIEALPTVSVPPSRKVEIPVCYDPEFAPDLSFVAAHNGLTEEEVIELHTAPTYHVTMIGFVPGFPYLEGMDERISTPRKHTPRSAVAPGSVGIGGKQTGVYPLEIPGGWQIIGRTPLKLFDPHATPPTFLRAGDQVIFRRIEKMEYDEICKEQKGSPK